MALRRRTALIGLGSTALVLVGLALVWLVWLPSLVGDRVAAAAARRGLSARVEDVHVGFGAVVLRGVHLEREDALSIDIGEVNTGADVFSLASSGASAARHVRLRDLVVTADVEADLAGALRAMRGEPSEVGGGASERTVEIEGVGLRIRDRRGLLLRTSGGRARLDGASLQASLGPIEIAPEERDGARIGRASVRVDRGDDGWQLSRAEGNEVAVRYRERAPTESSPLTVRLRRHARVLDELGSAVTGPTSGRGTTEPADRPAAEGDTSDLIYGLLERIGPRLATGGVLRVEGLSVSASSGGEERIVLRGLEAEVRALGDGRYRLQGSGRPGRGGRVGWNLTVQPAELRAEGSLDFQRLPFALLTPILPALPWYEPGDARSSGQLTIAGRGVERMQLHGRVQVEELALSSPRIAPRPVRRIAVSLSGEAEWIPATRRLEIATMQLGLGAAEVAMSGAIEWAEDHYLFDLRATLPPTPCDAAIGAIPPDLLGELTGFTFSGRIGGRVQARVDSRDLDAAVLDVDIANACVFETAPAMADVRRFEAPFLHRVVEPDGTTFEMETGPGTAPWTPFREISPFLVHAVLGHEDAGFFGHRGFATSAIRTALVRNLRAGRYAYGASTITMQLVKNVFLHREKTLARKVQEVLLTWWIETVMEKWRILELYLNVIEYGPGIYGIRNGAQHYFGRSPSELGPAEAAYLATILPSPKGFHSHWADDAIPERHRRRVARFLHTLNGRGRFDDQALAYALSRLDGFSFHHPGEPLPAPHESPGRTRPLPTGPADLDDAWEQALGPDDPHADDDAPEEPEDDARDEADVY